MQPIRMFLNWRSVILYQKSIKVESGPDYGFWAMMTFDGGLVEVRSVYFLKLFPSVSSDNIFRAVGLHINYQFRNWTLSL